MENNQMHWKLVGLALLFTFLTNFPGGYNSIITNTPQTILIEFINQSVITRYHSQLSTNGLNALFSAFVSIFPLGEFVGVFFSAFLSNRLGRKTSALGISGGMLLLASSLMGLSKVANSIELIMIGRLLSGIALGISRPIVLTYIMEIAFPSYRGKLAVFSRLAHAAGFAFGQIFGLQVIFGTADRWPYIFVISAVLAIIAIVSNFLLPESPKYLYVVKEDHLAAQKSIKFIYGEKEDYYRQFETLVNREETKIKPVDIKTIFKSKLYRRCTILSIVLYTQRTTLGNSSFISAYSTYVFESYGIETLIAQILSVVTQCCFVVGTIISVFIIAKVSRKRYFLVGALFIVIIYILSIILANLHHYWANITCSALVLALNLCDGAGASTVAQVGGSEVLPLEIRASVIAIGTGIAMITTFLCRLILYVVYTKIFVYTYFVFIAMIGLSIVYLYFNMPETNNRRLDEILADILPAEERKVLFPDRPTNSTPYKIGYGAIENNDKDDAEKTKL